jgi:hypothetical protein
MRLLVSRQRWLTRLALAASPRRVETSSLPSLVAPPEQERFARAYVERVRSDDIAGAAGALSPALAQRSGLQDSLARVARFLPAGTLDTLRLVGANRFWRSSGVDRAQLIYELHTSGGWAVVTVATVEENGLRYVEHFKVEPIPKSLRELNAFWLPGVGPGALLMLLVTIGCIVFSLSVALIAARTPMRRRWWWALAALVGAGKIALNWTTGVITLQIATVQLFSGGLIRAGLDAPWFVLASFPVGAIVTLDPRTPLPPQSTGG